MAIVYSTRVFAIDVEDVALPDGRSHEVATIRHAPCVVLRREPPVLRASCGRATSLRAQACRHSPISSSPATLPLGG